MMKWCIPAKTFLLGEYAALADLGAIILTTAPYFELTLTETPGLDGIHPDSPAGRWWNQMDHPNYGLRWYDPLNHCGGMGASSAQFVGTYWATLHTGRCVSSTRGAMLDAYWQCAWDGQGVRPSGYDVLAQSVGDINGVPGCVCIHRRDNRLDNSAWPFGDVAFIIAHTGYKLPTHHHLLDTGVPDGVEQLDALVVKANCAFGQRDSQALVDAVNGYHQALVSMDRVIDNTQRLISSLVGQPGLLAIKGCGAMGADVLLCLTTLAGVATVSHRLTQMNLNILARTE